MAEIEDSILPILALLELNAGTKTSNLNSRVKLGLNELVRQFLDDYSPATPKFQSNALRDALALAAAGVGSEPAKDIDHLFPIKVTIDRLLRWPLTKYLFPLDCSVQSLSERAFDIGALKQILWDGSITCEMLKPEHKNLNKKFRQRLPTYRDLLGYQAELATAKSAKTHAARRIAVRELERRRKGPVDAYSRYTLVSIFVDGLQEHRRLLSK